MINIQLNERMLYKLTATIPHQFPIPEEFSRNLKSIGFDFQEVAIHNNERAEVLLNVEIEKLRVFIKLFKITIPLFRLKRSTGTMKIKFFLKYNAKEKYLILTPLIMNMKFKRVPRILSFFVKSVFNVFYRHKARIHLKMVDIPLDAISFKRSIVISDVKTFAPNVCLIGHLNNHENKNIIPKMVTDEQEGHHGDKDAVLIADTEFIEDIFFQILPKFYSTGVSGLPDMEITGGNAELMDNNNVRLVLIGHLLDNKKNPFRVQMSGTLEYVRNKQHIQLSDLNMENMEIENTAYNSLRDIIELFVKAYLLIPIQLPNLDPITIPVEELGFNIKIMLTNPQYKIYKDLFVASLDIHV